MKKNMNRGMLVAALLAAAAAAGCAQDIGDIDRTEPNKIKKTDLTNGSWWMAQKIVDVSGASTLDSVFEGSMTKTSNKVIFEVEENYLKVKTSYPNLPGSDDTALELDASYNYDELYGTDYHGGDVVAVFPISSHFDVQRSYDTTTGEQSNVIVENTSDRDWWEREYMRVDWTQNAIMDWETFLWSDMSYEIGSTGFEGNDEDVMVPYFEYDADGQLVYFDTPTEYTVRPSPYAWFYGMLGWGWGEDVSYEVRVVTSFVKDLGDADSTNNYEPLIYPNADMQRFGYFRTERWTYDSRTGFMNSGRIELANRHNIWEKAYNIDADGNKTVIPIEDRVVRTTPFYIHNQFDEPYMLKAAEDCIGEWNYAFKRAVYIMQHPNNTTINGVDLVSTIDYNTLKAALASEKDVFVVCHIPVAETDSSLCGEPGFEPREGDFRKNFLWLVSQRTDAGLLGYGPEVVDPLTGRTISSHAHVYTEPMNEIAYSLVEKLRYAKGDLSESDIIANEAAVTEARQYRDRFIDLSKMPDKIRNLTLDSSKKKLEVSRERTTIKEKMRNVSKFDYTAQDNALTKVLESGKFSTDFDSLLYKSVASKAGKSLDDLTDNDRKAASMSSQLSLTNRARYRAIEQNLAAKGYYFYDKNAYAYDEVYANLAERYKDRSDYDQIYYEIRADLLRSTALHEMGHTMGLRHNFAASTDSMNYFDQYWSLRKDANFMTEPKTVGDMLSIYDYTDEQLNGGMLNAEYSSIMDYSMHYVDDVLGLGKYDHAAILYAYSAGTSKNSDATYSNGLVEYFTKGGDNKAQATAEDLGAIPFGILNHSDTTMTSTFDDLTAIGQPYLEIVNYRDFFRNLGDYDFIKNRAVVRLDAFKATKSSENPMIRVPYVVCTDDNHGQLRSCRTFDHGADYYEQVVNIINNYEQNYWFNNFARGRAFWDGYSVAWAIGYRNFMTLSDFYQSNRMSNSDFLDDILGEAGSGNIGYYIDSAASDMSFNFLASVIATPQYGTFCKRFDTGELFDLGVSDDPKREKSDFYVRSRCGESPEYYFVQQGEGRLRYAAYDASMGFDYSNYEKELGHMYVQLEAMLAIFDNEADVITYSGDIGTYSFGMYDGYTAETIKLFNGFLSETYSVHSPRLVTDDGNGGTLKATVDGEEVITGHLEFPALAESYFYSDADGKAYYFNPRTGGSVDDFNKLGRTVPMFGACSDDDECMLPNDDAISYCIDMYDVGETQCWPIWYSEDEAECPANTSPEDVSGGDGMYACIPKSISSVDDLNTLAQVACSDSNKAGYCGEGKTCIEGVCHNVAPIVEADSSYSMIVYSALYGMLLSGPVGGDSTFYDELNIYRIGSGSENKPGDDFEVVTFENPWTGEVYGANNYVCNARSDGSYPAWCYSQTRPFEGESGAVMMLNTANKRKAAVEKYWDEYLTWNDELNTLSANGVDYENSEAYNNMLSAYYKYYMSKYDLEYSIKYINFVTSAYDYFGSLW